jgi:hypothetical protein
MPLRTVEDRLREDYFDLLPNIRRATEHLDAEIRYRVLHVNCLALLRSIARRDDAGDQCSVCLADAVAHANICCASTASLAIGIGGNVAMFSLTFKAATGSRMSVCGSAAIGNTLGQNRAAETSTISPNEAKMLDGANVVQRTRRPGQPW